MGNFPNIEIAVGFMRCKWFSQTLFSKLSSPTSKSLKERISAPFYSDKKVCYSWKSFRELPVNGLELFQTWVKILNSIKDSNSAFQNEYWEQQMLKPSVKVRLFWEGHKNLELSPTWFDISLAYVKSSGW